MSLDCKTEKPTAQLRFRGDVLQQNWEIKIYINGAVTETEYEWRDVPTEPAE